MKKQAKRRQIAQQRQAQKRNRVAGRERPSRQTAPGRLLSHVPLAAERRGLALIEHLDGMAGLRNGLRQIAADRGDWAGIPMPLSGMPMTVEPTYPKADELMEMSRDAPNPADDGWTMVNRWFSHRKRCEIMIGRDPTGKVEWGITGRVHHASMELMTLGASDAWGIEQEARAVQLLGTLVRHRQFKQYLLTGMFLERSARSGVHYMFRKLRPTLAIREIANNDTRILCALCLHPIAYYDGTWAGGMCPTDDVIAHLALMRGDEVMFWRRANQHPPYRPEAGL